MIQKIYYVICVISGALIAGVWLHFGDHVPSRVLLPGLTLCTVAAFIILFLLDKWLRKQK